MSKKCNKRKCVTQIGGQAVLEGVMMRGKTAYATAVRTTEGNIVVESKRIDDSPRWWKKVPIVRGVMNFIATLVMGMQITMRSAEVFGQDIEEQEPSKFEKWLSKTFHIDAMNVAMFFGVFFGLALSIGLFMVLPKLIVDGITALAGVELLTIWNNLIEGGVRILIFVAYISLTSLMKQIKRLFRYHGAEHKTIACFEAGLPLTVENCRKMSKHHDRCGTNFMMIVMVVSILTFSIFEGVLELCGWSVREAIDNKILASLASVGMRLALLPLVAGVSYEVLKFLAKFDNWFVKILKAPGMALQLLTTKEPDDSMIEVAIKAFQTVQEMDADSTIETQSFQVKKSYKRCRAEVESILGKNEDKVALCDWILVEVTGTKRSELPLLTTLSEEAYDRAVSIAKKVAEGEPLQYVLGKADFCGYTLKVDNRVLIPRPETEELVELALGHIRPEMRVLDLCTGSGAIAIALSLKAGIHVFASDLSIDALAVAKENAESLSADVEFVHSDLFESIDGQFDLIVSNPPYINEKDMQTLPACVKREPKMALYGGVDGLDYYRTIIQNAPLCEGGYLLLEIGSDQADSIRTLLAQAGYQDIVCRADLAGHDRMMVARK